MEKREKKEKMPNMEPQEPVFLPNRMTYPLLIYNMVFSLKSSDMTADGEEALTANHGAAS